MFHVYRGNAYGLIAAGWGARKCALLEQFINGFDAVYADDTQCTLWARLRADARAGGRALSPQDAWIAAAALGLNSPLATNNHSDFHHIPKLRLLTI
ncbi:MAG TPA: PIN domain-containing protein [Bryobacteraceae bacterium]